MQAKQSFISNTPALQQSSIYLERPRLKKLLGTAVEFPLVAIYAGSGYGKTRTVYSFLQEYDAYTSWIQLSERDNVGARYWESYAHMISISWPDAKERLLDIGFPDTDEKYAKFESLMQKAAILPKKHIIVYDDFHLLHNPSVLRFIEKAINALPQNATVILLSRIMPDINITGLILRERIFTIYEDTLRFTEDEIAEYFAQLRLPVARQDIKDIYDDTQGWAFAINLIGRSLQNDFHYERYALEAMKANIFKLIEAEVTQDISSNLFNFLLRIALIDHLAADLLRTIAKDASLISEMEKQSAYIRYDSFLHAYVIHHLFLDYLRQNQNILTDEEKRETYHEAGMWCEKNNYHTDALSYYEKSGDWDAILQIVYRFDGQVPHDIAGYTLDIFRRAPEEVAHEHPLFPAMNLKLRIAMNMLEEASELAENYAKEYESRPDSPSKFRALFGIYYAWGLLRLAMCPYTGKYDFDKYFRKSGEYSKKSPFTEYGSSTNQSLGSWAIIIGESRSGAPEEYIEAVARSVPYISGALNGNMCGFDDLARGELCYFRREISDAEKHLKQALDKARQNKQYDIQNRALFYLMQNSFSRGDLVAATAALKSMEKLLCEKNYIIRYTTYDVAVGFYHLLLGQPELVPGWLKGDFSVSAHPALVENYCNRAKAIYHYQTRQYAPLLALIDNDRDKQITLFGKIGMAVLAALSFYQLKRRSEAMEAFRKVYDLAAPNRIIMPIIQYGKDMRTLTASALRDNNCSIPKEWLDDINRKASAFAKKQSHMISEYYAANNIKEEISLTKREKEILKDLSQGLSRTEIATCNNISVNTVKMLINIIYDKLYVNNLADAIRVAVTQKIV